MIVTSNANKCTVVTCNVANENPVTCKMDVEKI